jgi:hypothetical protein
LRAGDLICCGSGGCGDIDGGDDDSDVDDDDNDDSDDKDDDEKSSTFLRARYSNRSLGYKGEYGMG